MREIEPGELSVVIIAWGGYEKKAAAIEKQLASLDLQLSVYYNLPARPEAVPSHWRQFEPKCFFGCMFRQAVHMKSRGDLLLIHADAMTRDWTTVVQRYRQASDQLPNLGVWAPFVDYSPYTADNSGLGLVGTSSSLEHVVNTDGVVWGISETVLRRFKSVDFSMNPLGWGIDWMACAHAYSQGLLVVRDRACAVGHPSSSGYSSSEAEHQMKLFLDQLSFDEQAVYHLLRNWDQRVRGKALTRLRPKFVGNLRRWLPGRLRWKN